MDSLKDFFPDTCTIQEYTSSLGDYNAETKSWTDKFTDISCAIGQDTQQEIKQEDKTVRNSTHRIILKGKYDINEMNRVKSGSDYFDILLATEGVRNVKTTLICQKIEI